MTFTPDEQSILDALLDSLGPRKAGSLSRIIESDEPTLRAIVRSLRLKGVVVCSNKDGFYLARTSEDASKTARHLWSRVREIAKVARAFEAARAKKFGEAASRSEQIEMVFGTEEMDALLEGVA